MGIGGWGELFHGWTLVGFEDVSCLAIVSLMNTECFQGGELNIAVGAIPISRHVFGGGLCLGFGGADGGDLFFGIGSVHVHVAVETEFVGSGVGALGALQKAPRACCFFCTLSHCSSIALI